MKIRSRREFLVASSLTVGSFVISTGLMGCGGDDTKENPQEDAKTLNVRFDYGVASGDPLTTSVILWTRFTPDAEVDEFEVNFEVAYDEGFTNLVRTEEKATVKKSGDYTLKVDFQGLEAGTQYYYRFKHNNVVSEVGKTKTLPLVASEVKMAIFSCANYPKGYFNVYKEASLSNNLDVSLHLGDYIYEYGMFNEDGSPAYATENAENIGRVLPSNNDTELFELADYRKRYALYRTDTGAQELHKAVAMIAIWDDHEIANDAYKDGAENHNEGEGEYTLRKAAALQAYFEWMPIRPAVEGDNETIYRSFDFGDLVSLHMLDTRIIARDKQLEYGDYPELLGAGDADRFVSDLTDPNRSMMGSEQIQWLQGKMSSSTATWQVLGQQVLMGRMQLPAELLGLIGQLAIVSEEDRSALIATINVSLVELVTIKVRFLQNDTSLTPEELSRIYTVLPYNLDAWDGYFTERETILQTAAALGKNLIVLAGDTHNAWASNLNALDGNYQATIPAGVELACSSVSSPGMEEYVSLSTKEEADDFAGALTVLIDDLKYFNAIDRGFLQVVFTPTKVESTWLYVDNIDSQNYANLPERTKNLTVNVNTNTLS